MESKDESILREIVDYNRKLLESAGGDENKVVDELITLEYKGHTIWNPFKDETLRYEVNPEENYGLDNLKKFVDKYNKKMEG